MAVGTRESRSVVTSQPSSSPTESGVYFRDVKLYALSTAWTPADQLAAVNTRCTQWAPRYASIP